MKKVVLLSALLGALAFTAVALAGSPHFIKSDTTATTDGLTLTVSGKEAGLGRRGADPRRGRTADACASIRARHHPKATNKAASRRGGDFPVQNGKAEFSSTLTATFQPDCSPPMTVVVTDIVVSSTRRTASL